ncbi:MAG TPA: hypothetical protein VEC37_11265, partial [Bacillota bacterium]|nr:hypothetical protein [Bacillota bacterium]
GVILTYTTQMRTFQGLPGLSYSWVTVSVPVGSLLMMISTILKMKEQIKKGYQNIVNVTTKEFI